jgi:adenylate cyclase
MAQMLLGRRVRQQLPARVREAVLAEQDQAEVLISWAGLSLVLFFFALYFAAPKAGGSSSGAFMPVPFVLTGYLFFGLFRLAAAYHGRMTPWLLGLSILVDVSLLMGLIWSFHIQYGQPAPFYLKAPTFVYIFIFIALRALRFEATYVVATGVAAAAGWVLLVWHAIDASRPANVITRDYVAYLTGNWVLIGAEVDKVITVLLVTAILAVALVRARRLLLRAVTDQVVARDLSRFVAPELASRVVAADRAIEPGEGEVRTASILFTDIEGFSTISERLEPGALMMTLNDYFAAIAEVVDREDGVISMFQGDAMLIAFNTARDTPGHAAAAVRAALAIQKLTDARTFGPGLPLRTRCGINTGLLVAGAVGAQDRLYFTVFGDEVNIAARLEQMNKLHGTYILVSEATRAAAGDVASFRPIGQVPVRGRTAPVPVFAVDGGGLDRCAGADATD